MKKTFAQALLPLFLLTASVRAETEVPVVSKPPKYLFLVDTSLAFEPYKQTVRNKLYDLLSQGLDHRLKDGDTFTIWTFNDLVNTHEFPVVEWNHSQKEKIAARAYEYLSEIKFGGDNRWVQAQIEIFSAIKSLPHLTVIVISDGFRKFEGTPFDDNINGVYQRHAVEFRDAGKPFITTLVGYQGKIVGAAVNTVGEPLHDPTPKGLLAKETETTSDKSKEKKDVASRKKSASTATAGTHETTPAKIEEAEDQNAILTAKAESPSIKPAEVNDKNAANEVRDTGSNPPAASDASTENIKVETLETESGKIMVITNGENHPAAASISNESKPRVDENQPESGKEPARSVKPENSLSLANQQEDVSQNQLDKPIPHGIPPASHLEENHVSKTETKIAAVPDSGEDEQAKASKELSNTPVKKTEQPKSRKSFAAIAPQRDSKPSFSESTTRTTNPVTAEEKTAKTSPLPHPSVNPFRSYKPVFLLLGGGSLLAACFLLGALLLRLKPSHQPSIITESFNQAKR